MRSEALTRCPICHLLEPHECLEVKKVVFRSDPFGCWRSPPRNTKDPRVNRTQASRRERRRLKMTGIRVCGS